MNFGSILRQGMGSCIRSVKIILSRTTVAIKRDSYTAWNRSTRARSRLTSLFACVTRSQYKENRSVSRFFSFISALFQEQFAIRFAAATAAIDYLLGKIENRPPWKRQRLCLRATRANYSATISDITLRTNPRRRFFHTRLSSVLHVKKRG